MQHVAIYAMGILAGLCAGVYATLRITAALGNGPMRWRNRHINRAFRDMQLAAAVGMMRETERELSDEPTVDA